jgi:hypothetical protein
MGANLHPRPHPSDPKSVGHPKPEPELPSRPLSHSLTGDEPHRGEGGRALPSLRKIQL